MNKKEIINGQGTEQRERESRPRCGRYRCQGKHTKQTKATRMKTNMEKKIKRTKMGDTNVANREREAEEGNF